MTSMTSEIESRRQQLKLQQEMLLRGEQPPPIAPAEASTTTPAAPPDQSYTHEVLIRNSGKQRNSGGTQEELRNPSGYQEEHRGGGDRAGEGEDLSPGQATSCGSMSEDMPLREYVLFAARKNREAIEEAEKWQGVAFTFTRYMMSHPDLKGFKSQDAADLLDELLRRMFPGAGDPWVELLGECDSAGNPGDPFENFAHCWDTIQHPRKEDPLERAIRLAEEHPVILPGYQSPSWKPYLRLISICRWLQVTTNGESFFVPVRTFAEILGVAIKTVSNYRGRAEREGYLVLVKDHEGRQATEYRFNLDALGVQEPISEAAGDWEVIE